MPPKARWVLSDEGHRIWTTMVGPFNLKVEGDTCSAKIWDCQRAWAGSDRPLWETRVEPPRDVSELMLLAECELARRFLAVAETMDGRELLPAAPSSERETPSLRARIRAATASARLPTPRHASGSRYPDRTEDFMRRVLEVTELELGRVGFRNLRIDDIAARSGVNKSTIYRRWTTRLDLVEALLKRQFDPPIDFDLGTLEANVRACLYVLREHIRQLGKSRVIGIMLNEQLHGEVARLVSKTCTDHRAAFRRMFIRAIMRNQVPAELDPDMLVELMIAPLASRGNSFALDIDDAFIDRLTKVLCQR